MPAACSLSSLTCLHLPQSASKFKNLAKKEKVFVVVAAVFAGMATLPLFCIGGLAAFHASVEHFSRKKIIPLPKQAVILQGNEPKSFLLSLASTPFGFVSKSLFIKNAKQALKGKSHSSKILKVLKQHFKHDFASEEEFISQLKHLDVNALDSLHKQCASCAKRAYYQSAKSQMEFQLLNQMALPKTQLLGLKNLCLKLNSCSKKALYINAMQLFESKGCKNKMDCLAFSEKELKLFDISKKQKPLYFKEKFTGDDQEFLFTTEDFYDYESVADFESLTEYHVDFANSFAGGNMDESFEQEEIILAEMPNLANTLTHFLDKDARTSLAIRNGGSNRHEVLGGTPMPRIFTNAMRVQHINFYRNPPYACDLHKYVHELDKPQSVNILAMAAPKLKNRNLEEQLNLHTAWDLFNTFIAGFSLAKHKSLTKDVLIHSGKIGCGVFKNNWKLVFLLQMLAAKHLNIYLYLHDCSEEERQEIERLWSELLPKIQGLSLEKCIALIPSHLREDYLS